MQKQPDGIPICAHQPIAVPLGLRVPSLRVSSLCVSNLRVSSVCMPVHPSLLLAILCALSCRFSYVPGSTSRVRLASFCGTVDLSYVYELSLRGTLPPSVRQSLAKMPKS